MDSRNNSERTDLNEPRPALPPAALIELVRVLAQQTAHEAFAAALSPAASDVITHEPEDRP